MPRPKLPQITYHLPIAVEIETRKELAQSNQTVPDCLPALARFVCCPEWLEMPLVFHWQKPFRTADRRAVVECLKKTPGAFMRAVQCATLILNRSYGDSLNGKIKKWWLAHNSANDILKSKLTDGEIANYLSTLPDFKGFAVLPANVHSARQELHKALSESLPV